MQTVTTATLRTRLRWGDFLNVASRFGALSFLIILCIAFAILEPAFLSTVNIFNVLRQVSIYGLLAIGMTFVILTGGIDLSVGSLLALAGLVCAAVEKGGTGLLSVTAGEARGYGLLTAVIAALVVGLAGGFLQGLGVSYLKVPPFIVTLGGMSAFRGAALLFSQGQPISGFREAYRFWGQGMIGPVPVPVIFFFVCAIAAYIVLRYTKYGRHIYAVGGNREAARLSGLNVNLIV
ncbi:MAG: ABC transporter permease, partial [Anaerolineae bacterium]|nr:ABC transporter permease [Anaerolineae bacterium]MDW8071945.1 ABC transporter permease [Anaerolineae bacterium]